MKTTLNNCDDMNAEQRNTLCELFTDSDAKYAGLVEIEVSPMSVSLGSHDVIVRAALREGDELRNFGFIFENGLFVTFTPSITGEHAYAQLTDPFELSAT